MKELTIEEKAKAYDEAIERAKSKIKGNKDHVLYEDDIIEMFPELKVSKDESTRKRIIALVNAYGQGMYKEEMLAWLEIQGEQKEYPQNVIDNAVSFLSLRNDGMPIEDAKDIVNALLTVLNPECWLKQDEWEHVKQNSSWSEEDETSLVRALAFIKNTSLKDIDEIKESVITWIKSLKERIINRN